MGWGAPRPNTRGALLSLMLVPPLQFKRACKQADSLVIDFARTGLDESGSAAWFETLIC